MKSFKILFSLCLLLSSFLYGDCFNRDTNLISMFAQNNVRLVVMCNYQGTNNLVNIVSASKSPAYSLTANGLTKLQNDIAALIAENVTMIYTAPAFRAQQTTNLLGSAFNLPPSQLIIDARLGMQNFGLYEGKSYNMYKANFSSIEDMLTGTPLQGESGCAVFTRTSQFLNSLGKQKNQTIMVVTHAFNYCHITKILTGQYPEIPLTGTYQVYDFNKL